MFLISILNLSVIVFLLLNLDYMEVVKPKKKNAILSKIENALL